MPNSDNTYGTFNKTTKILSQTGGSDVSWPLWTPTIFSTVEEAKSHFFSTEALAIWDECCTTLEWALLADGNGDNTKLKVTYDFGTKGTPTIAEASDWCGQYNSRQQALIDSGNWSNIGYTTEDSTDHLF